MDKVGENARRAADLHGGPRAIDPFVIRAGQGVRQCASPVGRTWLAVAARGFLGPLVPRPGRQPIGLVAVRTSPARRNVPAAARTNG
jgi:hypothetical protein